MQAFTPPLQATLAAGAAAWPLLAGLTLVMWSKARAHRAALARVPATR